MPLAPEFADPGPLLRRAPDGRRAPIPLPPAVAAIYLALLIGVVPTALAVLGVALSLRRGKLALFALVITLLGFVAPLPVVLAFHALGNEAPPGFVMFVIRLLSVGLGWVLTRALHPHLRGHLILSGGSLPLLGVLAPAFVAMLLLPGDVIYALLVPLLWLLSP